MTPTDTSKHAAPTEAVLQGAEDRLARRILLSVLLFLTGWGGAVAIWGVPGLYLPALALVPVMFVTLFFISRG